MLAASSCCAEGTLDAARTVTLLGAGRPVLLHTDAGSRKTSHAGSQHHRVLLGEPVLPGVVLPLPFRSHPAQSLTPIALGLPGHHLLHKVPVRFLQACAAPLLHLFLPVLRTFLLELLELRRILRRSPPSIRAAGTSQAVWAHRSGRRTLGQLPQRGWWCRLTVGVFVLMLLGGCWLRRELRLGYATPLPPVGCAAQSGRHRKCRKGHGRRTQSRNPTSPKVPEATKASYLNIMKNQWPHRHACAS